MIIANNRSKKKNKNSLMSTKKVLLVEDEPIFQQLHFLMLEELDCHIDLAVTGEQALANAVHHYDIIFMDIGLPDIRGTVVIERIRQSDFITKNTPIIVLTAYNTMEIEEECLTAKANAVLSKPISSEIFITILKKYARK